MSGHGTTMSTSLPAGPPTEDSLYAQVWHEVNQPKAFPRHCRAMAVPTQASRAVPKTLSPLQTSVTMDSMLQALVHSAGILHFQELQNILHV